MITINHTKWFDREFPSGLPLEILPNVVERLRSGPASYSNRLRDLSHDVLTKRERDSWSIQENLGHVLDVESLWIARMSDFIEGKTELRPADLTNKRTYEAKHNDAELADILDRFREARAQYIDLIVNIDPDVLNRTALHPRLKTPMNVVDLAYFVAEHDIHHLVRITDLLNGKLS